MTQALPVHLREVRLLEIDREDAARFPFDIPAIRAMTSVEFRTPVTFLVGENGSGKSTFLEAVATAAGMIAVGSADIDRDDTLVAVRRLADRLTLSWTKRTRRGFFLRAEDFFGFARRMAALREDLERGLRDVDEVHADASDYARSLARTPYLKELGALRASYGGDLDDRSHGEGFLDLFRARLVPNGLYLLDEPEAPLSPLRQLAFLSMLIEVVREQRAQCIIATHSPILMAFPGATILSFDQAPIAPVRYEDLDHVTITRDFLDDPGVVPAAAMTYAWLDALEPGAPDVVATWRGIDEGESLSVRREVRRRAGPGSTAILVPQLATMAGALSALVEIVPDPILRAPGGEGDWNVAQCIGHACESRVGLCLAASLAAGGRWPDDAPRVVQGILGAPDVDRDTLLRKIAQSQRIVERAARAVQGHESDPCPLDHPQVGRLRCGEWVLFAGVHDLMHLEQVHDLLEAADR